MADWCEIQLKEATLCWQLVYSVLNQVYNNAENLILGFSLLVYNLFINLSKDANQCIEQLENITRIICCICNCVVDLDLSLIGLH